MTIDNADTELLAETVRAAMRQLSTSEDVRRAMATRRGWEEPTWKRLAGELGLPALAVAERYHGAGCGYAQLSRAFEETGAHLLCAPLFGTAALALPLLTAAGDDAALDRYAPPLVDGKQTATVALLDDDGRLDLEHPGLAAIRRGERWVLRGANNYVIDGATADLILTAADTETGPQLFAVAADTAGLRRAALVGLDQTRKLARLNFDDAAADLVPTAEPLTALTRAVAVARAMSAAEQAGGAQRCLDITVDYARTRYQFARPVGSFQMVKERLADMLIQVESARSAAHAAARALDDDHDVARTTLAARIVCNDAYDYVTAQMIQLHGGIGFTWEHDAHLYFKRARSSAQLLGDTHQCIDDLAALLATEIQAVAR